MSSSTSLDEIMRNFKAKTQITNTITTTTTPSTTTKPIATTIVRSHGSNDTTTVAAPSSSINSNSNHTIDQILQASSSSSPSPTSTSIVIAPPLPSVDEFLSLVNRQLSILLDGSSLPPQRKASFETLTRLLVNDPTLPTTHSIPAFKMAMKPLLKRFSDEREGLRQSSILLVTHGVKILPDLPAYLHYIIPVLAYRMGTLDLTDAPITLGANTTQHERSSTNTNQSSRPSNGNVPSAVALANASARVAPPTSEQSSAVRFSLLGLLYELMLRLSNKELLVFLADVCQILYTSLQTDREADVKIRTCELLCMLCEDYSQAMRGFSKILMIPLMQRILLDKSSQVRQVGIKTMGLLIPCGAAEQIRDLCAFREHNVIDIHGFFHGEAHVHYFARLVSDTNRNVRREFFRVVNDWSLHLYERADYETLIMPYVFTGLTDIDSEIRLEGSKTFEEIGLTYEQEEKERLANGIGGNASDEGAFRLKLQAEEASRTHFTQLTTLLYEPFHQRPRWGQRHVARKFLDRLLHAILSEKGDWKRDVSERSWSLLRFLLQCAEEHITQFSSQLYKAFLTELLQLQRSKEVPCEAMFQTLSLYGRYTDPMILQRLFVSQLQTCQDNERLKCHMRIVQHCMKFAPTTHPNFGEAFDTFLNFILEKDLLTSLETDLFQIDVELLETILSLQHLPFKIVTKHDDRLFEMILLQASWYRTYFQKYSTSSSTSTSSSSTPSNLLEPILSSRDSFTPLPPGSSKVTSISNLLTSSYECLLHLILSSMDECEGNLIFLFQLELPRLMKIWQGTLGNLIASWNASEIEFHMFLEIFQRVGTKGIFVNDENLLGGEATQDDLRLARQLEEFIYLILQTSQHINIHTLLCEAILPPLKVAAAAAATAADTNPDVTASNTDATADDDAADDIASFSPTFLTHLFELLSIKFQYFFSEHDDETILNIHQSINIPLGTNRQDAIILERKERERQQQKMIYIRYQHANQQCRQAIQRITTSTTTDTATHESENN